MTLDDLLAAAAAAPQISESELAAGLARLEEEHRRRAGDDLARARHAAFLDSLELEQAAYELGRRHEKEGNLRAAARWYGVAARGDHGDAALKLGEALDLLADRCVRQREGYGAEREQHHLIQEAAQAYAEAYAAGYTEAADKIDDMLAAYTRRKATSVPDPVPVERPAECHYVRDFTADGQVLREDEIRKLSRHAAHCLPCMKEFIKQVTAAAAAMPPGYVTTEDESPPETGSARWAEDPRPAAV